MAEKIFDAQVNYGWGLSLNMTGKAPAVSKRIFDTYADALAYANDVNDSAIEGLILTVVADEEAKNGVYFVQQVGKAAIEADEEKGIEAADAVPAALVKLGAANAAAGDTAAALQEAKEYADGIVKALAEGAVQDNTDAIAVLNGDAETEGSVAKAVADEKALREAAEKAITDRLDVIEGEAEGSIKKALADAKSYADEKVAGLDATVGSQEIAEGKHVAVEVVEVDGKLTAVTVVEDDIASAQGLADEIARAEEAEGDLDDAIKQEVADRQEAISGVNATIGEVAEGKTVVEMIEEAQAAAEAAATKIADKATGHVTVSVAQDETTGALTYTIAENDIASAQALADEIARAEGKEGELAQAIADEKGRAEGKEGELAAAISAETKARQEAIEALDATVGSQEIAEGKHVAVEVVEVDGKLTVLTVVENDIASAATLAEVKEDVDLFFKDASFAEDAKDTLKELQEYIKSDVSGATAMAQSIADNKAAIEAEKGRAEGKEGELDAAISAEEARAEAAESGLTASIAAEKSRAEGKEGELDAAIKQEVADRQEAISSVNATIGEVAEGKTVVEMIEEAQAAAEATATKIADKATGHVTVSVAQDETTGALTYTIAEDDIASAQGLDDEISRAKGKEAELATAIATEKSRAEAAESGLTASIAAETAAREAAITGVNKTITDNKAACDAALSAETKARQEAISSVNATIGKVAEGKTVVEMIEAVSIAAISVEAGNGIDVAVEGVKHTVAVKLDAKEGNALEVSENGLYLSNIIDCGTF